MSEHFFAGFQKAADAAHAIMNGAFGSSDPAPPPKPPTPEAPSQSLGASIAGAMTRAIGG